MNYIQSKMVAAIRIARYYCHFYKVRMNYRSILKKLKQRIGNGGHIKVVFLVNEIAKWKSQTLYDLFLDDKRFEVICALTMADIDRDASPLERKEKMLKNRKYFEAKGMTCVDAYDCSTDKWLPLDFISPDIIIYQQPYIISPLQMPESVSQYALTCYVPYYVANYGLVSFDCGLRFHRDLFAYFAPCDGWAHTYRKYLHWWDSVCKIVGTGHPALDCYWLNRNKKRDSKYVIYAPHWSFDYPGHPNFENFSTFLTTGTPMLEYAQQHPEIDWVFKPHPSLRSWLLKTGAMSKDAVDKYYSEWEKISTACYTADYYDLFLNSRALITDCGSFLTEYFCSGHPLIHLISSNVRIHPLPIAQQYFNTFYQVHNIDELSRTLHEVLELGNDPKRDLRLAAMNKLGFANQYAAKNIIDFITTTLI